MIGHCLHWRCAPHSGLRPHRLPRRKFQDALQKCARENLHVASGYHPLSGSRLQGNDEHFCGRREASESQINQKPGRIRGNHGQSKSCVPKNDW